MKKLILTYLLLWSSVIFSQIIINSADNTALPATVHYCEGSIYNLTLNAESTSTGDYSITETTLNIANPSTFVPFERRTGNSNFSKAIDIGFPFSFYGKTYTKVVVGSNGRLVFGDNADLENLYQSNYQDKVYSGNGTEANRQLPNIIYNQVDTSNPSRALSLANLFLGFTDIGYYNSSDYDKITYSQTIYSGKRGLLISFENIIELHSDYNRTISSKVLLLEDNSFIVRVVKRLGQNAILGIQNSDASKHKFVRNYNNTNWTESGNIAYLFTPNQTLTPSAKWFVDGVERSTDRNFTYLPVNDAERLKAEITFSDGTTPVGNPISQEVEFKKVLTPSISSERQTGCAAGYKLSVQNPITGIVYQWYKEGESFAVATGNSFIATTNGNYYVKANGCQESARTTVDISSDLLPIGFLENQIFTECDALGNNQREINLLDKVGYLAGTGYTVVFLDEQGNVVATEANGYKYTIATGVEKTLQMKVSSSNCTEIRSFKLSYLSLPKDPIAERVCFDTTTYNLRESFENVYFGGRGYTFLYSVDGGNTYSALQEVNPRVNTQLMVKIKHPNFSCESVINLNFEFLDEVRVMPITPFPEHCFNSTEYFDLNQTKRELEYSPDIEATFYTDAALTQLISNLNYRGGGMIYIKVKNKVTECFVIVQDPLILKVNPKPSFISQREQRESTCSSSIFDLTITDLARFTSDGGRCNRYLTVEYYDSSNQKLTESEWRSYNLSTRGRAYAKIFYYGGYFGQVNYDLLEKVKPQAISNQILICTESSYTLDNFKSKVISNPSSYTFLDKSGNPLTSDFSWSALPYVVKFYIKNNETDCISDLQQVSFVQNTSVTVNHTINTFEICDTNFDGIATFNLNDWKSQITSDNAAALEFYRDVARTNLISNPQNYQNQIAFGERIYGIAKKTGQCPSDFEFDLKVKIPTEILPISDVHLCYGEPVSVSVSNASDFTSIKWKLPDGTIKTGTSLNLNYSEVQWGVYTVEAVNAVGCPSTITFKITDENQPKIVNVTTDNDRIEVTAEGGVQPYTYIFNGVPQQSNILLNPAGSQYTIQVRSATGCLGAPLSVYFLKFTNVITPNGDGKNDVWTVEHLDKMKEVSMIIMDRYGKPVFKAESGGNLVWDGTEKGRELPSATYWYVIKWYDPATQRNEVKQGWILLKNY
ncbi:T9SS type B sorting domain-containing protein [Riemerella anatipestifer]|uniref:T9SS type B sorting domain-containing protein n=1 Tax=Riemerella anatipestifer TaxID=34085 RepID=UPI000D69026F|nr:T9SS type B sorting domain-containing protein [Riemerella anatipestifer]MRM85427.1 gliding motility-associated C-terminal domain-containing protein [Riemerella anatipestifer]